MAPATEDLAQPPTTSPAVRVYTLGGFRVLVKERAVEDKAWRRRTARQLFKALLSRPGRRMTRDEVVELFWPDSDPDAASSNMRSTLYAMRHALGSANGTSDANVVGGDHDSVWLRPDSVLWTDADAFEQKVAAAWRSPNPLTLLEEASLLYLGEFLPDDIFEDWAVDRRETLKRTWTELQFGLAKALETHADVNAAMQPLERLLRSDPCDERAARELMSLLDRHGRRADALRVYQRLVQALREELDVEPSSESVDRYHQIVTRETIIEPPLAGAAFRCAYPFPSPTELIGRDAELSALMHVLATAGKAGRVALVAAPAGTGKSALVGRLVREAQTQGALCLAGGCYEGRGSALLGPFHDALVDFLLAQPPDWVRTQLGNSATDLAQIVPELGYHLQLPPDSASSAVALDRVRAFAAIHSCLRSLAERGPVLLCLEDLHAADEATLQLLHYLGRQTRRLPLLLVGTYRSDEAPIDQPLAQTVAAMLRERVAERIQPNSLGRDDTNRLLTILLSGSPSDAFGDSLYATTGGNPLFVEQLVLALVEAGLLQLRAGLWEGVAELQGTPPIVREVIAQRLQRLEPSCRDVLAMASVLGESFEHKTLLAAIEPADESTLLRNVDRAIAAQILQDTVGGYTFRHVLLRDAVYWQLTTPRRMLLHARAGTTLEEFYGSRSADHAAELAHHFLHAGEAPAIRAKALQYSTEAGRRAAALSSYPEALTHFGHAWDLLQAAGATSDPDLRLEVLRGRGLAETQMAKWRETAATYEQTLKLSTDPVVRARSYGLIAYAHTHLGELQKVIENCDAGLTELRGSAGEEASTARLQLQQVLAMTLYWQGCYRDLIQLGTGMEAEASSWSHPRPAMLAQAVIGWGYWGLGQTRHAIGHLQLAIDASEQLGEKPSIAASYENMALAEYAGGRFSDARAHLGRALALYDESASELRAVNSLQTLCRIWLAEGDHSRARRQITRTLEMDLHGQERWAADAYTILGNVQTLHAEWDQAAASFERAIQMRTDAGHRAGTVEATVGLGLVRQHTGGWQAALKLYEQAVQVVDQMDPSPPAILARRHLGGIQLLAGHTAAAAVQLERVFELCASMPDTLESASAILAMAELRDAQGRLDEAVVHARDALARSFSVQQILEADVVLAALLLKTGEFDAASSYASDAVQRAGILNSPRHLSSAHLASARTAAVMALEKAIPSFELAVKLAESARTPYELAAAYAAFAAHLVSTRTRLDQAEAMDRQARQLLRELRADFPDQRAYG